MAGACDEAAFSARMAAFPDALSHLPPMKRTLKNALKAALRTSFEAGQRLGVDILPRHFYSEIPDIRQLRQSGHWMKPLSMEGVAGAATADQLDFLRQVCTPALADTLRDGTLHARACAENGEPGYGPVEADEIGRAHV